jgi:hypothetical protein
MKLDQGTKIRRCSDAEYGFLVENKFIEKDLIDQYYLFTVDQILQMQLIRIQGRIVQSRYTEEYVKYGD